MLNTFDSFASYFPCVVYSFAYFLYLIFLEEWLGSQKIVGFSGTVDVRPSSLASPMRIPSNFSMPFGFSWTPHEVKEKIIPPWTLAAKGLCLIILSHLIPCILSLNNFYYLLVSGAPRSQPAFQRAVLQIFGGVIPSMSISVGSLHLSCLGLCF